MKTDCFTRMKKLVDTMHINEKIWESLNSFKAILSFSSKCEHLDDGENNWDIVVGLYPGQESLVEKKPDLYVGLNCLDTPDSDEIWLSELAIDNPSLFNEILDRLEKQGDLKEKK